MKKKYYSVLFILIFILTTNILRSQEKNCYLYNDFWSPDIAESPKRTNVILNNLDYIVYYRYHIVDRENKFYIESIESINREDINWTITSFGNLNLFMNKLMIEFIQQQKSELYSWTIKDDTSKILSIDIISKIDWKIVNMYSSNNESHQFLVPCSTDVCYYIYFTIHQTSENTTLSIKEFEINPEINYYGKAIDKNIDCISIIKVGIK